MSCHPDYFSPALVRLVCQIVRFPCELAFQRLDVCGLQRLPTGTQHSASLNSLLRMGPPVLPFASSESRSEVETNLINFRLSANSRRETLLGP